MEVESRVVQKMPFLSMLISQLRSAKRSLRSLLSVDTFELEGIERASGESIRIYFAGVKQDVEYFGHMSLQEGFSITALGRRFTWMALLTGKNATYDIQVVAAHRFYSKSLMRGKGFQVPRWVGTEVDTAKAKELAEHSKSLKWDMRKVTRNGYEYEITHDRALYDYFYEKLYLPYISTTYDDRSFLMSYKVMMSELEHCELGFVKKDGQRLAGGIIIHKDGKTRGWSLGVLNGNKELVKEGVITALYYFETLYLLGKGIEKRSFGSSRAFLKDGVLKFKRKWGITLSSSKPVGFFMRPLRDSAASRAFLENNPFIFEAEGRFRAGIFVPDDFSGDFVAWLGKMHKDCYCDGLSKLYVFCPEKLLACDLSGLDVMNNIELKAYSSVF